ncbi:MAG: hypothetical protein NE330_17665 [Lentisphaeraceae bacterium]|nr:hypothetical protein [Lentisphaeraceae bacterium]
MKKLSILMLSLLILVGCGERVADIKNPNLYFKSGLKLSYPGNWNITSDEKSDSFHQLILETSGDGIVIVQAVNAEGAKSLKEYANDFSKSMSNSVPIGKIVNLKTLTNNSDLSTEINQTFSIEILGQKVPHNRKFALKKFGSQVCFLIFQISSEDASKADKGFELIHSTITKEK